MDDDAWEITLRGEQEWVSSGYRWLILMLTCGLCFLGNYMQYQVAAYATIIMPQMNIDSVGFSSLFLAPMLAAVFFSLPFGSLGDRFGPKVVILGGFCVSIVGGAIRIFSLSNFPVQLVSMFCIGVGMAALTANNAKTLGLWFADKTDVAMGIYYAATCFGIAAAQASSSFMPSVLMGYTAAEGLLVVLTILWGIFGKNVQHDSLIPDGVEHDQALLAAFRSRNVWLCAICAAFSLAATTAFSGVLPQALELVRGADASTAGEMAALTTAAGIIGCLIAPILYGKCRLMRPYLVTIGLLGSISIAISWSATSLKSMGVLLAVCGMATSMMGPIVQALPVSFAEIGTRYAGSAGGIMAEVSLLGSYALPIGIAAISGCDYDKQMMLIALLYGLSVLPILVIPEAKRSK